MPEADGKTRQMRNGLWPEDPRWFVRTMLVVCPVPPMTSGIPVMRRDTLSAPSPSGPWKKQGKIIGRADVGKNAAGHGGLFRPGWAGTGGMSCMPRAAEVRVPASCGPRRLEGKGWQVRGRSAVRSDICMPAWCAVIRSAMSARGGKPGAMSASVPCPCRLVLFAVMRWSPVRFLVCPMRVRRGSRDADVDRIPVGQIGTRHV